MTVECLVNLVGLPRNPYTFAVVPRVGEKIKMEDPGPIFEVREVHHIAQDAEGAGPLVILFVEAP